MKLWVTGAKGLLGSALRNIAAFATSRSDVDIGDLSSLRAFATKNHGVTHIVNCAAFSLVDLAETHREEAFRTNAMGPENLGILAREIGARLIHISTDYVFGGEGNQPLRESDPAIPCNYYGLTKLEGERRLQNVFPEACVIRTSWLFGQGGKNFVAKMLEMLQHQEEILLTNDHWGRPTYVADLASMILRMLDMSGVFHFANEGPTNKYEFGLAMRENMVSAGFQISNQRIVPTSSHFFSSPARRPPYSVFDTAKIEQEMNMHIRSWSDALREFLWSDALIVS